MVAIYPRWARGKRMRGRRSSSRRGEVSSRSKHCDISLSADDKDGARVSPKSKFEKNKQRGQARRLQASAGVIWAAHAQEAKSEEGRSSYSSTQLALRRLQRRPRTFACAEVLSFLSLFSIRPVYDGVLALSRLRRVRFSTCRSKPFRRTPHAATPQRHGGIATRRVPTRRTWSSRGRLSCRRPDIQTSSRRLLATYYMYCTWSGGTHPPGLGTTFMYNIGMYSINEACAACYLTLARSASGKKINK